ncbi:hypothetical protein BT93_B1838 [Corymbia citriodora subsp. variegata]|nr:hypothetical protein BT93_B1838 [Corymbia citriodora subsp. variegata]
MPESNLNGRVDEEALLMMEEAKRKKRMKWTIGIIAFVIFQVVQALFFVLVIMKFKSPKFRISDFAIPSSDFNQTSPSFNMNFTAPIRVKNTNWGPFKYDASTVDFMYEGSQVGQAIIPKSKANFKSTKKINVPVTLSSTNLPSTSNLKSDLSSGFMNLTSQGELRGKVTIMFMFKKKKISQMNCTIAINTSTKEVQSLSCK